MNLSKNLAELTLNTRFLSSAFLFQEVQKYSIFFDVLWQLRDLQINQMCENTIFEEPSKWFVSI